MQLQLHSKSHSPSLKPSKCKFATTTIQYLGHTLTPAGVWPNEAKITAVKEFPRPQSVKQVKSFLGLANFYRRHIPNMAALSRPLTNLTRKENLQRFVWSPQCTAAFEEIKERLATAPCYTHRIWIRNFFCELMLVQRGLVLY